MGQGRQSDRHARRLGAALALSVLSAAALAASAQAYPAHPIRMIVPSPTGASLDTLGRIVAAQLSAALGQQVIVDNRPGAGNVIGTALIAKAAPDGYTLGMIFTSHTTNASLQKLPYDPVADFAPITMVTSAPLVLIVPAASNIATVKDLVAAGKARPLTYGSAGVGSGGHLSGEMFRAMTGIDATHVPYKGAAAASVDVAGGQLSFQFASQITIQPLVAGKRVRMLAVTSARRAASLPDVPSLADSGLAGFEVLNWFGATAPARTPPAIVARLNATIVKALQIPDVREKLTSEGGEIVGNSPAEFTAFLRRDIARWAEVIRTAGIRIGE
jgi:tripartite-type tricarboxylate transporter receptor subunit TctC